MTITDDQGNKYELVEHVIEDVDDYGYLETNYTGLYMLCPIEDKENK